MKHTRTLISIVCGVALMVCGSAVWNSRDVYSPEVALQRTFGDRLVELSAYGATNLGRECDVFNDEESWIIFALDTNLVTDKRPVTYFETSQDERQAVIIEQESSQVRLVTGLGPESSDSTLLTPIRTIRATKREMLIVGITKMNTRMIADGIDRRIDWPNIRGVRWSCDYVQVAREGRVLSEGYNCYQCEARLQYVTGRGFAEFNSVLNLASNRRNVLLRTWIGNSMLFLGIFLLLVHYQLSGKRDQRAKSDSAPVTY